MPERKLFPFAKDCACEKEGSDDRRQGGVVYARRVFYYGIERAYLLYCIIFAESYCKNLRFKL